MSKNTFKNTLKKTSKNITTKIQIKKISPIGFLLALIAFLTRFIYLIILQNDRLHQFIKWLPHQNHDRALKLLQNQEVFFANAWGPYYLVLASQYWLYNQLLIKETLIALVITNILFSSIAIYIFYKLARLLFNQNQALISTILLIIYFPLVYFNSLVLNENIFLPLLITSFYLLALGFKQTTLFNPSSLKPTIIKPISLIILSGFLLGLATSIRSILFPFLPIILIWLYLNFNKNKLPLTTTFLISLLIPILAFMALNYRFSRQHLFQLSGSTGINLMMNQCQYKKVTYQTASKETFWFSPPLFHHTSLPSIKTTIPFYHQLPYAKQAWNCLISNPTRLITNFSNPINLFHSVLYPNFSMEPFKPQLIIFSKALSILSFFFFVLYPFLHSSSKPIYSLSLGLILSLFISVYLANPGEERYLAPYIWVFFLFTPPALTALIKKFRKTS